MSVKFENPIEIHIEEAFTYGVCNGKYGGFNIPTKLEPNGEFVEQLKIIAESYDAKVKLYGAENSTLYLGCDQLSEKQSKELLNQGKMIIDVTFQISGLYVGQDKTKYIKLDVTKLRKVKVPEKILRVAPMD